MYILLAQGGAQRLAARNKTQRQTAKGWIGSGPLKRRDENLEQPRRQLGREPPGLRGARQHINSEQRG